MNGLSEILEHHRNGEPDCAAHARIAIAAACDRWDRIGMERAYRNLLNSLTDQQVLSHAAWLVKQT